jgi:hypothetical protein
MSDETLEPTGGLQATADKSGKLSVAGRVALDPTQTSSILANMQAMIDKRESPMAMLNSGLERAAAWGSGGIQGPSEALNRLNVREQGEEKSVFDMRQQMAAYRAAQAQQEALNRRKAQELTPGTPGVPGAITESTMPPQIRNALNNARTEEDYNKIYNAWAQKQSEIYANPAMDKPDIPVVENVNGQWVRREISAREYRANPNKYRDTPQTQAAVQTATASAPAPAGVPVSVRNNNPGNIVDPATGKIRTFATPAEGEKALESDLQLKLSGQSPAVKARFGPQVGNFMSPSLLAETWAPSTAPGNTPESTANYAKAISTALGVDTTSQIPNTPEALAKAKAAITQFEAGAYPTAATPTAPAATPTALGPRPTPSQLEQETKTAQTYREGIAKGYAENVIKDEIAFRNTTEPKSVIERKTSAERVIDLVQSNPNAVGILTKPGIVNALTTIARDGLNTPSGAIGIKTIEDALVLTMPGTSQKTVNARKEIAQNLAKGALEASKLSQGQGSVSDFERSMFERIAGSLADTPDLLIKRQKMLIARAELDQKLGSMYRSTKVPGKPADYEAFTTNPQVVSLIDKYEEQLRGILGSEVQVGKPGATSGKTPGGIQFKVITPAKP